MRKVITAVLAACALAALALLAGCSAAPAAGSASSAGSSSVPSTAALEAADALRVASMKGPTSVGLASMMQQEQGQFTVCASADEVAPLLLQDKVDIACVPANLAATLYQKTDGAIRVIDVNTMGVLGAVTADASVDSIDDLAGRTVYMTGKGTVPEYTLSALLAANGLSLADVDVQFKSEPAEVAALLAQDAAAIGILPQPYATAVTMKSEGVSIAIDLTQAWAQTEGASGDFVTGVTVAKASTIEQAPEAIAAFLERHRASADVANADAASVAQTVVDLGIIDNAKLAEASIPRCNVVCLTGSEMKAALSGYLEALFAQNPQSVGGALPADDFYYVA